MPEEQHLPAPPKTRKAICAECGGERHCTVHGQFDDRGDDGLIQWNTSWRILQCRGCDYVFVQTVSTHSEDYDHDYDEDGDTVTIYHETVQHWPAISSRNRPEWINSIGIAGQEVEPLTSAMSEVYGALDSDLRTLAAIGIRTAFDVASELLGVNAGLRFFEKLEVLVADGHIGQVDKERLKGLVDAGSASAHRGWRPKPEQLDVMMEVLEHFVEKAFVTPSRERALSEKAEKMRDAVPAYKHAENKSGIEI